MDNVNAGNTVYTQMCVYMSNSFELKAPTIYSIDPINGC